ncbi:NAD-dependent epimerase/dehydratase family protein [Streptomyces sp. CA-253872]|uniref:NAD-dependent epimerase/dehydratase family protein n=1 Tax=Streptomyces sp. CA-253872 TaxID=3240067 RepID=UPI003D916079
MPEAPGPALPAARTVVGTVLVAGGTGFIGGAVVRALKDHAERHGGPGVRALSSRGAPAGTSTGPVTHLAADLTRPGTLRGVCEGATTLVHAASYVGRDSERCEAVNRLGTVALLAEARRAGVRRVLYVSTASVYGTGPHRGPDEGALSPRPASAASASRLHAERAVLAAGGVVLRPHLVYGEGDRWLIPALAAMARAVPDWPVAGHPLTSAISVTDLARCVAALALAPGPPEGPEIHHLADPRPLPVSRLVRAAHDLLGMPPPAGAIAPETHRSRLAEALPSLSAHQYALLTRDHWYDSRKVWRRTGRDPGPGFAHRFAESRGWYAGYLGL